MSARWQQLMAQSRLRRYAVAVALPTLIVWAYLGLVATEGYVARAEILIEHDDSATVPSVDLGLLSIGSESDKLDALVVQTYMRSRAMLAELDAELDLRGHFASTDIDPWQRLGAGETAEGFLDYYRALLETEVDPESFVISVAYTAYDAAFAQAVVAALLRHAEQFVNAISRQMADEKLRFIRQEVDAAQVRLKAATRELIALQRQTDVLSPEQETTAAGQILGGLLAELARQRTELRALQNFLNPDAPEVALTRQKVRALEEQIEDERERLVGADGAGGLNDLWLRYQDAEVNLTLTQEVYKNALASLETTRLDAARKAKFLVALSPPLQPEEAERPRTAYWTLTVFVFLNLVYLVAGLLLATIRDHRE